ncbi:hypothetical protein Y032_0002g694 [Ancylostoma ceylanicum]|uniref:Uncharacterized protein n=1 Tax=Ancylostoma ceylanicum TaxID=53326 RepID=A0A016W101_9BILA|nr:hypothetical protein Y032_0002g694 [Ancylostoma ceylanicum]
MAVEFAAAYMKLQYKNGCGKSSRFESALSVTAALLALEHTARSVKQLTQNQPVVFGKFYRLLPPILFSLGS